MKLCPERQVHLPYMVYSSHYKEGIVRKSIVFLISGLIFVFLISYQVYGQEDAAKFPSKPVTFIMPIPPGSSTDLACRLICKEA